jgi:hypothetical protein
MIQSPWRGDFWEPPSNSVYPVRVSALLPSWNLYAMAFQ